MLSAIPCSLSPLISRIHCSLFSDWRYTVSSKFFDTKIPSISTEELVPSRHAPCILSRLRCNEHGLLLSSLLSRIGRSENPSCSACGHPSSHSALFSYELLAQLTLWRLYLSTTSGPDPGELLGFGGSMVFLHAPSLGRGRATTTTNFQTREALYIALSDTHFFSVIYCFLHKLSFWQSV